MSQLQGLLHPDFAGVATTLRRLLPKKGPGGAAVCVYHRGEKVVDIWGGTMDDAGTPWEGGHAQRLLLDDEGRRLHAAPHLRGPRADRHR